MKKQTSTQVVLLAISFFARVAAAETCESLITLKLPDTAITLAQRVAAGAFKPTNALSRCRPERAHPHHCTEGSSGVLSSYRRDQASA
jgi:hypothetical protein